MNKLNIPPYTITSKILKLSTQISEELTKLQFTEFTKVNPMLRKKNRIKTLAGTLEIEGNFIGEEKITAILDGKKVLGTVKELAEVEGAIKAYEKLDAYMYDSLDDLLLAHKILMGDILTSAGSFRGVNVQVGEHIAPQPSMVSELMQQLFSWLQMSNEHLLLKSCIFHYEFEFIHPFSDGNGRIGRLWQTVILNRLNPIFSLLPTESIVRDNQEEYYNAIESSTQNGESTPFIEFMLEMILKAIQNTLKSDQKSNYKSDQKILSLMQEKNKITIKELMEILAMSESGVKKVIKKLKDEGILNRVGSLKSGYWEVKQ
ncbi:Fic family protein [Sulfurimonas sp.]|uniref:Fic family protein n=1 Tax=Sulfurimonas sp. TaxID=2022749 RepID=UPI00260D4B47|nr:Fic family protein [Sulfurimonas sp.]MDD5158093.1 Fic family protein [Sulfurimonas sp.]